MNKIISVVAFLSITYVSPAQRLLTEDFNYNAGQLTSAGSGANVSGGTWLSSSGTGNYLPVVAGGLSYTAYSTGASATNNNKVNIIATSASAEDAYRDFPAQTSGTVYMSFLMTVTDQSRLAENSATPGDFFTGFLASNAVVGSTTTFAAGRVYIRKGLAANTFNLGITANAPSGGAPTPVAFSPTDYAIGTTHLVTVAYKIIAGDYNDSVKLFVDKPESGLEPVFDAFSTYEGTVAVEPLDISRIFIRQGTGTQNGSIDAFKVSTNYHDATLPVQLTSFSGILNEGTVSLTWNTVNEVGVKEYVVERSEDFRSFEVAGRVDARNTSSASYSFADRHPFNGTTYYRLKVIDKDGAIMYSKSLVFKNTTSHSLQLFPNPATNVINISHQGAASGARLVLMNGGGQILKSMNVRVGTVQSNIIISDIIPGVYTIVFINNGERSISTFLKK